MSTGEELESQNKTMIDILVAVGALVFILTLIEIMVLMTKRNNQRMPRESGAKRVKSSTTQIDSPPPYMVCDPQGTWRVTWKAYSGLIRYLIRSEDHHRDMNGLEVKWSKSAFSHFPIEGFKIKTI